ncbi:Aste57867_15249 [Aphanomyces stellatus]|uniref:Aste57867_15249 protein n=1 Tax=Aphanomyces stellatus TaxID=120398 RepID=A0A485L5L1_9STRA|nr:hypothetical protein As57867_015193 [Aphanomyces stellatus]VFT92058.1 Aste57867_15249 [Aphanomyces stellatus]
MPIHRLTCALLVLVQVWLVDAKAICSALTPYSLVQAAKTYPELEPAISAIKGNAIASWYTDRSESQVAELLAQCTDAMPVIVVYGLPMKDCAGGFSQLGSNTDAAKYTAWIQALVNQVGSRDVLYVLEPDAIGNLAGGGCGVDLNYLANMKTAVELLSTNPSARIYIDVASWADQKGAIAALNDLKTAGHVAGVALNTANYLQVGELAKLCTLLSSQTGGLHCVVDTSRNFHGAPYKEWCNAKTAGIGTPTTDQTGYPLLDFYLWLKVPGESDGRCVNHTQDAMPGPNAGDFFYDYFTLLWNQGYYVVEKKLLLLTRANTTTSPSLPSSSVVPVTTAASSTNTTIAPSPTSTLTSNTGVALVWNPCGGSAQYQGPTVCVSGSICHKWDASFSQCIPTHVGLWGQCGGKYYTASVTCTSGSTCQVQNAFYSQCVPST